MLTSSSGLVELSDVSSAASESCFLASAAAALRAYNSTRFKCSSCGSVSKEHLMGLSMSVCLSACLWCLSAKMELDVIVGTYCSGPVRGHYCNTCNNDLILHQCNDNLRPPMVPLLSLTWLQDLLFPWLPCWYQCLWYAMPNTFTNQCAPKSTPFLSCLVSFCCCYLNVAGIICK
jgi:hypothetical protein